MQNKHEELYYKKTPNHKNTELFKNHLNQLLLKHSKLYPIRLDFHFKENTTKTQENAISDMYLLYSILKSNHVGFVGMCFSLEYSTEERLHIHSVFYANGQKHQHFKSLLGMIQETWESRISDSGNIHCCNFNKNYKYDALIKFSYQDEEVIKNLNTHVFPYMAKQEQKESVSIMNQIHCSAVPKISGRGRPRRDYTIF